MDKALAEEKADKRLELLKASFQSRTRRVDNLEDDDEYVPSVLLHAEQVKVEVSAAARIVCHNIVESPNTISGKRNDGWDIKTFGMLAVDYANQLNRFT